MADILGSLMRGRALGRAAAFLGMLSVLFVWYSFQDHSRLVRTDRAGAAVEAVKQSGLQVRLATGETVLVAVPKGISLKEGDSIPVRIETYESGRRIVLFDAERWASGGG